MRISDWSSDVCSSDLFIARFGGFRNIVRLAGLPIPPRSQRDVAGEARQRALYETKANRKAPCSRNEDGKKFTNEQIVSKIKTLLAEKGYLSRHLIDRKSDVWGKRVSVRVDLCGRRSIKKK